MRVLPIRETFAITTGLPLPIKQAGGVSHREVGDRHHHLRQRFSALIHNLMRPQHVRAFDAYFPAPRPFPAHTTTHHFDCFLNRLLDQFL
jgi:hypothetical protein